MPLNTSILELKRAVKDGRASLIVSYYFPIIASLKTRLRNKMPVPLLLRNWLLSWY